jgi:uncharacterized protein (DUF58 family)
VTPSKFQLGVLGLWVVIAAIAVRFPALSGLWQGFSLIMFACLVLDIVLIGPSTQLDCERTVNHVCSLSAWHKVQITIRNHAGRNMRGRIGDHAPQSFLVDGMPAELMVPARGQAVLNYRVRPLRRGDAEFPSLDVVVMSPLRFWRRRWRYRLSSRVKVYPNFKEITRYTLLAIDNQLSQIGIRQRRRRGEGSDFHQLREYRAGDPLGQIDWKATARSRRLISKEYQDDRDQQIVFMVDCGFRMRHQDSAHVHFDQALNAMLLLAYVALNQGDAVGFLAFGGQHRWFAPRKGSATIPRMMDRVYDIESTPSASDYLDAAMNLMPLQKRRALVVILTNTRDEVFPELLEATRLLRKRHLVVVADLREEALHEWLHREVATFEDALRYHAVNDYLRTRRRNHESLRHRGAITLDVMARQLPIMLVNQYFALKRTGRI